MPILLLEPFRHEHDALSRLGQNHWMLRGAGVGYIVGLASGQDWLREASIGCALGNTANALPRKAVYRLISRARPSSSRDDAYDFDVPGGEWAVHSFFGGHAANAFSCATFLAHRWDLGWAEPVVWALAIGVAGARTADEAHWASDTVVGSAFGYAIGRTIAARYLERAAADRDAEEEEPGAHRWRVDDLGAFPVRTPDGAAGLLLSGSIRF